MRVLSSLLSATALIIMGNIPLLRAANVKVPEQIHLAFGPTPDTISVQWATLDVFCTGATTVQFGLSKTALTQTATGSCFKFNLGSGILQQSHHVAYMQPLAASTKYYYKVGDGTTWSSIYFFKTAPDAVTISTVLPQKFLVYGDMGSSASPPAGSTTVLPWVTAEVHRSRIDMILHIGDFAYDMDSNNGQNGRLFMNDIQNASAYIPYMVDPGNHEVGYNFAFYTEFFRGMPSNPTPPYTTVTTDNGVAPNNWYFSWNLGLVHFVTISSEIYFDYPNLVASQWNWLKADLQTAAANRTAAPWIIVNGHRSIYCSCDGDCDSDATALRAGVKQSDGSYRYGVESLLYQYGVDLWINGHEHNYERMYDVEPHEIYTYLSGVTTKTTTNPPGPIYIVTGDAGNYENHESNSLFFFF